MAATPLAVDQYSRYMAELFDEKSIIGVPTVYQHFFGRPEHGSKTIYSPNAKVVEIDIMRGNERLAGLIQRGTNSRNLGNLQKNTDTQNYSTFSRVYPLGEEEGDITADQILSRVAGENPYENRNRLDRMRTLAREHHLEHIRRYARLFEVLAGFSLLAGQMPALLGTTNPDMVYDFRRRTTHLVTPAIPWDNAASDPIADIDEGCHLVRVDGHVMPNFIFMGSSAFSAFEHNARVRELAHDLRIEQVKIKIDTPVPPQLEPLVAAGAIPRGMLRTAEGFVLYIFTYLDVFTLDDGTAQKYLPEGTVFLGFFGARCDRYFGPPEILPYTAQEQSWYQEMFGFNMIAPPLPPNIKDMDAVISPAMFYSSAYQSEDKKKITCRTQAAPIFATTMTDCFYTMYHVVTTSS